MHKLVKSIESPSLHFTIHHPAPQGDVWSIRCGPTLVLIRRLEMIFLNIANALNTLGRCNALPRSGMPRQTWVMSILNAPLTEESHFVRSRRTRRFPTKIFKYCLQTAPRFLRPTSCMKNPNQDLQLKEKVRDIDTKVRKNVGFRISSVFSTIFLNWNGSVS